MRFLFLRCYHYLANKRVAALLLKLKVQIGRKIWKNANKKCHMH